MQGVELVIELLKHQEIHSLQKFINTYWSKGHIFSVEKSIFDWQYKGSTGYFCMSAKHGKELLGIQGFIPQYHFDKNFSWHFSVGLPSFTTGFTISNQRNSQHSFIIGNIIGEEYCLRYAWVKQKEISKKLFWCYGLHVPIIMFDNNGIESLISTAGSEDAALFLPLPIINLKYQL